MLNHITNIIYVRTHTYIHRTVSKLHKLRRYNVEKWKDFSSVTKAASQVLN